MKKEEMINRLEDLQIFGHEPTVDDRRALEMAIELLSAPDPIGWTKPLSDSTLSRMSKSDLVEYVRMCEKNLRNAMQTIDQQAKNAAELLKGEERTKSSWAHLSGDEWFCMACGHSIRIERNLEAPVAKYCDNCGADMKGEKVKK